MFKYTIKIKSQKIKNITYKTISRSYLFFKKIKTHKIKKCFINGDKKILRSSLF